MADRLDPSELLGVDVDQLARPFALIAHDRWLGLERAQLAQPETTQNAADRRDRHGKLARNRRAAQALAPPALDVGHAPVRHLVGTMLGRRAPVDQRRGPAGTVARKPAVRLPVRQSRSAGRRPHSPALICDPLHQQESTLRRQTRILMHVHPGDLPISAESVATRSLTGLPRMNNLHSNHS
jgi:hypothetical protein